MAEFTESGSKGLGESCSAPRIAIIGSGGGAFAAAIRASEAGAHVTMVEAGTLGGTCVNVGCIPSKMTLRAAETAWETRNHPFAGIARSAGLFDRSAQLAQLRERVNELRHTKYERIVDEDERIELLRGVARFANDGALWVRTQDGCDRRIDADRILIATGAKPALPPIPGLAETPWWDSTDLLFSDELPPRLAVIGSSFVALEMAQAFCRLGSEVTLLARGRLLGRERSDIGEAMRAALEADGVRVLTDTRAARARHDGVCFLLETNRGPIEAERLLVATGRTPNTPSLNLAAADVATDAYGAICVNDRLQSSNPRVYAVGDCAGLPQLVYVAAAAGTRAAVNMAGGDARLDLSVVPTVLFTDPQVAAVGMDEHAARRAGVTPDSRRLDIRDVPRAAANFDTSGFVRLIAEQGTGRLVGARIVARNAGEMIETAALAVRHRMTVDALAGELFPYLTMSEALRLCAQSFTRDVSRLSCCAG